MSGKNTAVLNNVKARMQALRDELDNLKDSYDLKCKECEQLTEEKNQVKMTEMLKLLIDRKFWFLFLCQG